MKVLTSRRFWNVIKKSQSVVARSPKRQHERLVKALVRLSPYEIIMFDKTMRYYSELADTEEMRAAVQVINGKFDEAYFKSFRGWLITRGRKSYFRCLRNAENLRKVLKYSDDPEWEGFPKCAAEAFERKTGKKLSKDDLKERKWQETELAERFPRLWKRFVRVEEAYEE